MEDAVERCSIFGRLPVTLDGSEIAEGVLPHMTDSSGRCMWGSCYTRLWTAIQSTRPRQMHPDGRPESTALSSTIRRTLGPSQSGPFPCRAPSLPMGVPCLERCLVRQQMWDAPTWDGTAQDLTGRQLSSGTNENIRLSSGRVVGSGPGFGFQFGFSGYRTWYHVSYHIE